MNKQTKRWLRALGIAKILFEEEGYHTRYLKEIEEFIRRNYVLAEDQRRTDTVPVPAIEASRTTNDENR